MKPAPPVTSRRIGRRSLVGRPEVLWRQAHPEPSPTRWNRSARSARPGDRGRDPSGRRCTTSPAATWRPTGSPRPGGRPLRATATTRWPAVGQMADGRPAPRVSPASADPHRAARASRSARRARRPPPPGRPRARPDPGQPGRRVRAARYASRSSLASWSDRRGTGPRGDRRECCPTRAGRRRSWLRPDSGPGRPRPTEARRADPGAPSKSDSASTPASLASSMTRSLGHLTSGVTPATAGHRRRPRPGPRRPCSRCSSVGGPGTGRSNTEHEQGRPGGPPSGGPSRPRPADWWSATATSPAGAPRPGLVEQIAVGRVDARQSGGRRPGPPSTWRTP